MHALAKEWVDKAAADFFTACREARVRKAPNYDANHTSRNETGAYLLASKTRAEYVTKLGHLSCPTVKALLAPAIGSSTTCG